MPDKDGNPSPELVKLTRLPSAPIPPGSEFLTWVDPRPLPVCPYCLAQVVEDEQRINGIRPAGHDGCSYCRGDGPVNICPPIAPPAPPPPVVVNMDGEARRFADPFAAAVWLLHQCSPVEVQRIRSTTGREILRSFPADVLVPDTFKTGAVT